MRGWLRKLAELLGFRERKPKADLDALPLRSIGVCCGMSDGAIRKVARRMDRKEDDADVHNAVVRILMKRAARQVAMHLVSSPEDYLTLSDVQKNDNGMRVKVYLKIVKRYGVS